MSLALILACLWVVASAGVAMLPIARQFAPGLALLLSGPVLVLWLALVLSPWVGAAALVAFASIMRNPLRYMLARLRGTTWEGPQ